MSRAPRVLAASALALALPHVARACAVCAVLTDERTRRAIFNATVFMTLLPLAVIGWGLLWLARRGGEALRSEFRESPDATAEAGTVAGRS